MKTFINYIFSPIVLIITSILSLPITGDYVKANFPNLTVIAAVFVIISSALLYFFNQLALFKTLEGQMRRLQRSRQITPIIQEFKDKFLSYKLTVIILIPKTKYFFKIEPKNEDPKSLKRTWVGKVFYPEWQSGIHMHQNLVITINQGYSGEAYGAGAFTGVKCGVLNNPSLPLPKFGFNEKQIQLLKGLVFVACCAIPDANDYNNKPKGVLSVESRKSGAEVLLTQSDFIDQIEQLAVEISNILV